jgi:hypothetical protein
MRTTHRFHLEVPTDLWERFKDRAIRERGSPRQAALDLFREYVERPDSPRQEGQAHASDDER